MAAQIAFRCGHSIGIAVKDADKLVVCPFCASSRSFVPPAAAPSVAPEGFVCVPKEPTPDMIEAYLKAQREDCEQQDKDIGALRPGGVKQAFRAGYRAMLAAAPAASPVAGKEG